MKVLLADRLDSSATEALSALRAAGQPVIAITRPDLSKDDLPAAIADEAPDVLVVRSTKVSAQAIAASDKLKLIVRAGAGVDNIDVTAASRTGVFVANCPGKNAIAVAELTWGLILACDRRVAAQDHELKSTTWNKKLYSAARGLYGRTLAIIGFGSIGREVAWRGQAFGMSVVVCSRSLTDAEAAELGVTRVTSPVEAARVADVLSVHLASTPETEGLLGKELLSALRPETIVINTSRGTIMDEAAMLAAIEAKKLRVGVDVYRDEPGGGAGAFESALARHPAVVGTHHIGASTDQAQEAIAAEVVRVVERFAQSGIVDNCVNLAARTEHDTLLTVRHKNRPGVLAKVFDVLSRAEINVEWMDNILYQGEETACARIQLGQAPNGDQMQSIRASTSDILSVDLSAPAQG